MEPITYEPTTQERDAVCVLAASAWFEEVAAPFSVAVQLVERLAAELDQSQIDKHYDELHQKLDEFKSAHRVTGTALRHGPTVETLSVLLTVTEELLAEYEAADELYRRELRHLLGSLAHAKLLDELRIRLEDRGELAERDARAEGVVAQAIETAEEPRSRPPAGGQPGRQTED